MDLLPVAAVGLLLLALIALVIEWALWRRSRSAAARLISNAEKEGRRIEAQAEIEGTRIQKDVEILARERLLAARTDFERETRELRLELTSLGSDLDDKKSSIQAQIESLTERETSMTYQAMWNSSAIPQKMVIQYAQFTPPPPAMSSSQKNALMIANTATCQSTPV